MRVSVSLFARARGYERAVPLSEEIHKAWNVSDSKQTLGFVGGGFLACSVIEGLCTVPEPPFESIKVFDPAPERVHKLAKRFDKVQSVSSNIEAIESADIMVLAVRPEHCATVLPEIKGKMPRNASLLSFVASKSRTELAKELDIDIDLICKVIPVPSAAEHRGTTIIYPDSLMVANLFSLVGSVHPCRTSASMEALLVSACLMGSFFRTLKESRDWCSEQGCDPVVASEYLASLYTGIVGADVKRVCSDPRGFDKLLEEQTPGGFNHRLVEMMQEQHVYSSFRDGLSVLRKELNAGKIKD